MMKVVGTDCVEYTRIPVLSGPHIPAFRLKMEMCGLTAYIFPYSI